MIKKIDLSVLWDFELDADKKGIEGRFFDRKKNDSINLPGTTSIAKKGTNNAQFEFFLGNDAALWSEYTPVIYRLEINIDGTNEKSITTFGLRKFSTTDTKFLINGEPTFLRGKHDGLVFPLTGAVPTTVDEWLKVMKM